MRRQSGDYIKSTISGEEVRAFVPNKLPPVSPTFELTHQIKDRLVEAEKNIALLSLASKLVPNINLFAYAFVRKEAIYSSQIEGVQATLTDLLNFEAVPEEFNGNLDVLEVCNYLDALEYGKSQLNSSKGLPLSLRLVRELHKRLMKGVRGASKSPGEFRKTQNWIGGTRPGNAHFVPPPAKEMTQCLESLESFMHEHEPKVNSLIRIGWVHAQFETIHPFLDGNGRVGRLLIALLLELWAGIDARMLYLSLFFKIHRQEYYRKLDSIRQAGDWEAWIEFFLDGISQMAKQATEIAQSLFILFEADRKKLLKSNTTIVAAIRLYEELPSHPILTISAVTEILKVTKPTAAKAVNVLCKLRILEERTGGKRNRLFGYRTYLDLLLSKEEIDV